ncbi:MAG TPA: hypothetical protein VM370_10400 [Candidatus Thermoplasmatota archaeon]|nr:hypothetical protein [Candidatus Thermoplasmatota archaeon]
MGITPLTVAAVAGVLLIVSVAGDLAFTQSISLEAGKAGGALVLVAEGPVSGNGRDMRPGVQGDPIALNRSDNLTVRVTLEGKSLWPVSRSYALTTEGCYPGARTLAELGVAGSGGAATASATIPASKLFDAGRYYAPKPIDAQNDIISLTLCRGDKQMLYGSLILQEVPSS